MIPSVIRLLAGDVPVDPSSPDAKNWIDGELAKPEYQAAKPTWFDIASKAVQDWLASLFQSPVGSAGPVLLSVVLVLVAGLIVAALLIFGRPRLNRRGADDRRSVFGADDTRSAAELRASAAAAARSSDWVVATEELFRAIAQSLDERTIVSVSPGTTATEFAARAARSVPAERERFASAARAFDDVRYLGRPGTEAHYQQLVALDQSLQQFKPPLVTTGGTAG